MFILLISFILIWLFHFYSGFRGPFKVAKGGIIVPGVPSVQRGYWGRVCDSLCYDVLALCKTLNFRMLCFVNKIFEKITPYSLFISHTKMSIVFRSVHELYCTKACYKNKQKFFLTSEPCMSSNYETLTKTCD